MDELESLMREAGEHYYHYFSMRALAEIHSALDRNDGYWLDEVNYLFQNTADVQLSFQKLQDTLYASSFREQIEREWSEDFFATIDDMDYVTEETAPLYEEEAALITQHSEMMATATVEYNGENLTYYDIMELPGLDEYQQALSAWYKEHNPVLGELYIDLVTIRQEIAHLLGYENYAALYFNGQSTDYTLEMARAYLDDIVTYAVPAFKDHADVGFLYNPDVSMNYSEYAAFLRDALYQLSPDLLDAFDAMEYFELIDYAPRTGKDAGGMTTYIYDYDAPFILMTYDEGADSMITLLHEFGHFYDAYCTYSSLYASTDMDEVYSKGLETLVATKFGSAFGSSTGYEMCYDTLSGVFTSIVEQPLYTAIELRVYSLPPEELTVDAVNQISLEEFSRFGVDAFNFEEYNRYDWVSMPHIYQMPFYTLAYSTSGNVALQLFELSLQDEPLAVDTYHDLIYREQSDQFIENVEAAGLKSPFSPGQVQWVADFAQKYLIEEDWQAAA